MPIGTTYTLSSIFLLFPALTVALLQGPSEPDVYAVLGAAFATAMVTIEGKPRSRRQLIATVIACGAVGAMAPGLLVHNFFADYYSKLTWHAWATMGFLFGGCGYGLATALFSAINKRVPEYVDDAVERAGETFQRLTGSRREEEKAVTQEDLPGHRRKPKKEDDA